jgi:glyoxylase-like metal-dependent hydrolase (beta-lactamase superfamily II)
MKAIGGNFRVKNRYGLRPEIILNEALDLEAFGLAGKIISTPGHTLGSTSLILDDGRAFTGDLLVHERLLRGKPVKPPFMMDFVKHKESMQKLCEERVKTIYPGHGVPIQTEQLFNRK